MRRIRAPVAPVRPRCEVTGRSQARRGDPAACAACLTLQAARRPPRRPRRDRGARRSARRSRSAASPTRPATPAPPCTAARPKNVIFFLGDGMGDQEVTAARYYQYGAAGHLNLDRLPFTGFQTTWSVKPGDGAATSPTTTPTRPPPARCGRPAQKTIDERISQGPSSAIDVPGKNLPTVLEQAQKAGQEDRQRVDGRDHRRDAGGARLAHLAAWLPGPDGHRQTCPRRRRRPRAASARSPSRPSTTASTSSLGGGRNRFAQTITRRPRRPARRSSSPPRARATPRSTTAAGLAAATRSDQPLLGLFTAGNMTTEWNGPVATRGDGTPAQRCMTDNRPANEPSLPAMTKKAIDLLEGDRDGFFLQVEGASIDKQDHAANACAQIGETDRVRQRDRRRAGLPAHASRHADRRHRRPRAHEPDRRRGHERHRQPDRLLEQPSPSRRPDAARHLRHGGRRDAARRLRRASSTPAPWCPICAAGPRRRRGARHDRPHGPVRGPRRRARTPLATGSVGAGPRTDRPANRWVDRA